MLIAYHPWKHFLLVAPDMQANSMGNMMFVTIGENATFYHLSPDDHEKYERQ